MKKTGMAMKMAMISAFLFTLVFFISAPAQAACTNPAGVAGEEIYNSSRNILQYCNGENWVAMVCNNEGGALPAPCSLPWGGSILDSEFVTAYQNATEPFGGSCTSETRSCSNGALSGTYANQNCSVSPPADCTPPWGGTVTHGNDVTAYQNATEPFGGSCTSETRSCNNGALSGSYSNQNCTVLPAPDTTPNAFTFTDQTDVSRSTLIYSNTITISGINAPTPVTISGSGSPRFSINGGSYVTSGTITNGQTLRA